MREKAGAQIDSLSITCQGSFVQRGMDVRVRLARGGSKYLWLLPRGRHLATLSPTQPRVSPPPQ